MKDRARRTKWIWCLLLPGLLCAAARPGTAAEPAQTKSQAEAAAILQRMAQYVAGLTSFTVKFRDGYDVVQASGQKIEFGETRSMSVARPDRLRVDEISSDSRHDLAVFDGRTITVYDADAQAYAQASQPGSVDDALVYYVRDLRMRMPLALMLTTRLPAELSSRVQSVDYVESTEQWGAPADHIAGRTANVDFQFWIQQGAKPLPLRVVISYRNEPGQPQFWANLADWDTAPKFGPGTFEFQQPAGARRIGFAVQAQGAPRQPQAEVLP